MLSPEELRTILAAETERVEWKESAKATDLLEAICALANDLRQSGQPGYLVLGIDNRGNAVGVDASDAALQRLTSQIFSTKLMPHPSCLISWGAVDPDRRGILTYGVDPQSFLPGAAIELPATWETTSTRPS